MQKIIVREGLILLVVVLLASCGNFLWMNVDNSSEAFMAAHDISLTEKAGRKWGVFATGPLESSNTDKITEVIDISGNRREMGNDGILRIPTFDMADLEVVDKSLSEAEKKRENESFRKDVIERRALLIQALKGDERATFIKNILNWLLTLLMLGYPLYALFRLIRLIRWTIKTYGLKKIKSETIKLSKVVAVKAFSKDILVRATLILGIIYLSISILKSCNFE